MIANKMNIKKAHLIIDQVRFAISKWNDFATQTNVKKELKELYWEHLNTSSNLMTQSKQTEVAKLTEVFGLKESVVPPTKIEVNE